LASFWSTTCSSSSQQAIRSGVTRTRTVYQRPDLNSLYVVVLLTLPSGLQYEVLKAGNGPKPKPSDVVATHYRGTHLDGKEFDKSDPEQGPLRFPVQGVIPGWQEALSLMPVGSTWRLWVPPDLGYGDEGSPPAIEPGEVLVFEMELLEIEAAK
jgi:FKBP-type peptidyl-prolyl cis-trans isomerase FklB